MNDNAQGFEPPEDRLFQYLVMQATQGKLDVYGAVIETDRVEFRRTHDSFRPENTSEGQQLIQAMWNAWQAGDASQPWLYVWDGAYAVADDYFWIALVERGKPESIAAQVLGEPLKSGLIEKVGPLPRQDILRLLGFADPSR